MASYLLRAFFANTCPQVRKVANELKSDYKVEFCRGQKVLFSFESECNKAATEHSRDILNVAIEKGLFVAAACLLWHEYPDTKYVADWEFRLNKGYHGDDKTLFNSHEEFERWADSLNLKQED